MINLNTNYDNPRDIKEQLALFAARLSSNPNCFMECHPEAPDKYIGEVSLMIISIANAILLGDVHDIRVIADAPSIEDLFKTIF